MDPEEYLSTFNFGEDFAQYEFIFYKIHFELGVIRLDQKYYEMDPEEYLSTFNFGEDFAQYEFIFYKIHFELGVIRLSQMLGFILPAVMNDSFPLMFSSYIITRIVLSKLLVKRKDEKMFCLKEKGRKKAATSLLKLFCPIEERNVNGSCNNEFKEECKDAVVQK